jgi:hypothetical protein
MRTINLSLRRTDSIFTCPRYKTELRKKLKRFGDFRCWLKVQIGQCLWNLGPSLIFYSVWSVTVIYQKVDCGFKMTSYDTPSRTCAEFKKLSNKNLTQFCSECAPTTAFLVDMRLSRLFCLPHKHSYAFFAQNACHERMMFVRPHVLQADFSGFRLNLILWGLNQICRKFHFHPYR